MNESKLVRCDKCIHKRILNDSTKYCIIRCIALDNSISGCYKGKIHKNNNQMENNINEKI